ncbi:GNAT family N-acetyltransferase [Rhizobium leguminosarum]|uniref:GNAT family N-acetyltransferase n=1 Tax=Rhizobium leguminosarum TaxID=384 RepID=UPI001442775B|nr:GNAT family N-acetyltransferase [Rhizobium leguminosarum]NKN03056.1 GNAT family N-acetyltransferase [Rhizobium leguminosarum bv. viciae]
MRPTTIQITLERHLPADVQLAIRHHILEVAEHMPSHESNAYDAEELSADGIRLWSARDDDSLLSIVALKNMGNAGEVKSMRVLPQYIGQGIGRALLLHIIKEAKSIGYQKLYLETAPIPYFLKAIDLYTANGFVDCAPFGDYRPSSFHRYFSLDL